MAWHHNGRKSEFTGVDDNGDVYDLEEKLGTLTLVEYRLLDPNGHIPGILNSKEE